MKRVFIAILTFIFPYVVVLSYAYPEQNGITKNNWNQFRGPNGDGKATADGIPTKFNETKNLRWKTPIHDKGYSSPVVWGNKIWVTTAREDGSELFAVCVDLHSGDIKHDIKVFEVAEPQLEHADLNSHASPTPIVEDGRIYVHYGTYGTACLDTKTGDKLWERRNLNCDHRVRPASSPIIDGDSLFLTFDGIDVQFVAALNKRTGDTLWLEHRKVDSDFEAVLRAKGITDTEKTKKEKPNDNRKSYATPTIITYQGKKQLVSPAAEVTISYDPKTGDELWRIRHEGWGWNVACRPIFAHNLVYFTTGIEKRLVAVDPSGTGNVTDTHIVWSIRRGAPEIPSPLIVNDLMFMVNESGVASCVDAKNGNPIWKGRIGGKYWASPLYADGKIYFFSMDGRVSVISVGREFKLLAQNEFDGEFIASGAVAGNALILRSDTHLYCIEETTPSGIDGAP
ncbi:MAG: PQQ-binding-like beta-propeller repeat protein [Candidatus Poribacteria bacterium]|nr:PQQ-binding-like beta-propeller repeat protein [Candidatus Poribacteria bacterium]